jgi:hypothetical protein
LFLLHDVHAEVFDPETMTWSAWPPPPPIAPDQVSANPGSQGDQMGLRKKTPKM